MPSPVTKDESARLEALRSYGVLDTPPEAAYDDITFLAAHICATPISLIALVDERRQWFKSHRGLALHETPREIAFSAHALDKPDQLMVVEDAQRDPRFASNPLVLGDPHIRFFAGAPLVTPEGQALGTLCVIDSKPRQPDGEQLAALRALAQNVVTLLELGQRTQDLEQANELLTQLSTTDALTGVGNRLAFSQQLEADVDHCHRYKHPLSLMLVDIDHFKTFNEQYGHPGGDEVLKTLGELLSNSVRGCDRVCRYGGEEFALLLPETDANGALVIGQRLLKKISATAWPHRPITTSAGIATLSNGQSGDVLVAQADQALYWVKQHGRANIQHFDILRGPR